jgi:hypothetical protein
VARRVLKLDYLGIILNVSATWYASRKEKTRPLVYLHKITPRVQTSADLLPFGLKFNKLVVRLQTSDPCRQHVYQPHVRTIRRDSIPTAEAECGRSESCEVEVRSFSA